MTEQPTDNITHLIDEYARKIRDLCVTGGEYAFAVAFVDALTNQDSRISNARCKQRVRAVVVAAEQVRAERLAAASLGDHGMAVTR